MTLSVCLLFDVSFEILLQAEIFRRFSNLRKAKQKPKNKKIGCLRAESRKNGVNSLCASEQVRKKDTMKTLENIKAKFLILNI